jgi:hypothetical protein
MPSFARTLTIVLLAATLAGCSLGSDASPKAVQASPSPSTSPTPSPTPSGPEPIESTFFGSHDHDPVASWPDGPVGSLRAWDAGVTWREIETAPGQYDFGRLDALVDQAEQHDSDVLLVLGQTPTFHATDPAAESFYGAGASSPPDPAAWTKYVHTVAKRYAGRPVILQVWNEANVSGFWSGTQQQMADLTKAAHDALDGITPRPTLVAPALVTRLTSQRAWIDAFYGTSVDGTPVADFVDVVSLQLYPAAEGTPETSMELLTGIRSTLAAHGVQKPIWNTEINYGLTGQPVDPFPEREQVRDVVATYLLNAANGVTRVYWYGWDQQSIVGVLLTEADGVTLTKAGDAFVTVHDWMLGATVTGCEQDAQKTWTCTLDHPDGPRTVYWNADQSARVTVPEGAGSAEVVGRQAKPVQAGDTLRVGGLPVMVGPAS